MYNIMTKYYEGGTFMVFSKAKLFKKTDANKEYICAISYDERDEYYTFLKKQKNEGYKQVIVTADIMIDIIRMTCLEKNYAIYKIELAEDDDEIQHEINLLIDKTQQNKAFFGDLIQKIEFLAEQSSIDLARVYIKGQYADGFAPNMFIQSNGILGVNKESFEDISRAICTEVERCLLE